MAFRRSKINRMISKTSVDMAMDEEEKLIKAAQKREFINSLKVETKELDQKTGKEIVKVQYDIKKLDDTNIRKFMNTEMIEAVSTFRKLEKEGKKDLPKPEEQDEIIKLYLKKIFGENEIYDKLEMFIGSWIENVRKKFDLADQKKLPNKPLPGQNDIYFNKDDGKTIYQFELYYKSLEEKQDEIEER